MFAPLTLANTILGSIIALALITILNLIILPWIKVNSFKGKKGASTYFFPLVGMFSQFQADFTKHNDMLASSKLSSKRDPDQKYLVTNLINKPFIVLRDPQYYKELVQKPHLYKKASFFDFMSLLVGTGLGQAEGEIWKRHRQVISNSFHYEFLKANVSTVQATVREFFEKYQKEDLEKFSVMKRAQELTGEIIGRTFFGDSLSSYTCNGKRLTVELAEVVGEIGLCGNSPLVMLFGAKAIEYALFGRMKRVYERVKNIRRLCIEIVEARKRNPVQAFDLLTSLINTQKSDDPNMRYSDVDIVNEFIFFAVAGMDTTGHLIGMSLYNLTQYPQYQKDLKEERDRTFNTEKIVTIETLGKMDVLHSVLKESLRFYTPAASLLFREVKEDHEILDLKLKKGMLVTGEMMAMYFNEKYFKNPEEFDPERWRKPEVKIDPYAFAAFSAGPRNCIGQNLAIIMAKVIISEFLERFDMKLSKDYKLKMMIRFAYEPQDDIELELTPVLR